MSRIPPAVIAEIDGRRDGTCEATGLPVLHVQYHHRRAYAMGGRRGDDPLQNIPENLLGLCMKHHAWAHAHPTRARDYGWIVPSDVDPREVPVRAGPWAGRC